MFIRFVSSGNLQLATTASFIVCETRKMNGVRKFEKRNGGYEMI